MGENTLVCLSELDFLDICSVAPSIFLDVKSFSSSLGLTNTPSHIHPFSLSAHWQTGTEADFAPWLL
jgi:hypothetical protein